MSRHRILIVDDEDDIRELLAYTLKRENFDVLTAADGETALKKVRSRRPDLIVLDLMLPGIDGLEVCRMIRQDEEIKNIPVIMLTAKADESDEVIGFGVGADDYVTKPFSPRVLLARVKTVLRRGALDKDAGRQPTLSHGPLTISPECHEANLNGEKLALTPIEFKILYCLTRRPGRVFTRNQIIDEAQGEDVFITERTVDVHVAAIRKKIGKENLELIETVRGIGYKMKG